MAESIITFGYKVVFEGKNPTDWNELINTESKYTIHIHEINTNSLSDTIGAPQNAYSWGFLLTIPTSGIEYRSLQLYVPDTNTESSNDIFIRTGNGRWLKLKGEHTDFVTKS